MAPQCNTANCKGKPKHGETLCAKCKKSTAVGATSQNNDNNQQPELVVNEVLMYAEYHRNGAAKDNIIRVIASHFSVEDLYAARGVLIEKGGALISADLMRSRKDSNNRTEKMKVSEDILEALELIEGHVNCMFVAHNWLDLPKCGPEEVSELSVAEKVAVHDAKFKSYDDTLSTMQAQLMTVMDRLSQQNVPSKPLLSDVVAGTATKQVAVVSQAPSMVTVQSAPQSAGSSGANDGYMIPPHERRRINKQAHRTQRDQSNRPHSQEQHAPGGRRGRRPHIVGQSNDSQGLRATPTPDREFFVYRVHKDDGEDELKQYITSKDVDVRQLIKTSHDESKFNSFRLVVSQDDMEKVMDPAMWPRGVCIRRWRRSQDAEESGPSRLSTAGANENAVDENTRTS